MTVYIIKFNGYIIEGETDAIPKCSGIYLIYTCAYKPATKIITPTELLYIGQSKDLHHEVTYHARREEFLAQAKGEEKICYAYAEVALEDLNVVENALVYSEKPRLNILLKDGFNYSDTELHVKGSCDLLCNYDYVIKNGKKV